MTRYDLLLCSKSFFNFFRATIGIYQMDRETRTAFNTISQHRLVYTDKLLDQYKQYALENGLQGDFEMANTWLSGIFYCSVYNDQYVYIQDDSNPENIDDAIYSAVKDDNVTAPLVLCDVCDACGQFAKRMDPVKLFPSNKINGKSVNNKILRNTTPFSVDTKKDEPIRPYMDWFGELFKGEKSVTIFDRYALKSNDLPGLAKCVLEQIEPGTTVEMYVDNEKAKPTESEMDEALKMLAEISTRKEVTIRLYLHYFKLYNKRSYHDRRVFTKDRKIILTAGFDTMCRSMSASRIEDTGMNISIEECDSEKVIADLLETYKGYTLIGEYK